MDNIYIYIYSIYNFYEIISKQINKIKLKKRVGVVNKYTF